MYESINYLGVDFGHQLALALRAGERDALLLEAVIVDLTVAERKEKTSAKSTQIKTMARNPFPWSLESTTTCGSPVHQSGIDAFGVLALLQQQTDNGFRLEFATLSLNLISVLVLYMSQLTQARFTVRDDTDRQGRRQATYPDIAVRRLVKHLAHAVFAEQTQLEDLVGDFGLIDETDTAHQGRVAHAVLDVEITLRAVTYALCNDDCIRR